MQQLESFSVQAGMLCSLSRDSDDAARARRAWRRSYGCDCSEPALGDRSDPDITNPYLDAVEKWTGSRPLACPWRALSDPFVQRVMEAHPFFESGQLELADPDVSPRLRDGVVHFDRTLKRVEAEQIKEERDNERARAEAR